MQIFFPNCLAERKLLVFGSELPAEDGSVFVKSGTGDMESLFLAGGTGELLEALLFCGHAEDDDFARIGFDSKRLMSTFPRTRVGERLTFSLAREGMRGAAIFCDLSDASISSNVSDSSTPMVRNREFFVGDEGGVKDPNADFAAIAPFLFTAFFGETSNFLCEDNTPVFRRLSVPAPGLLSKLLLLGVLDKNGLPPLNKSSSSSSSSSCALGP